MTHVHARYLSQLEELERATALAEKDYARFRIEKAELASRRSWNATTRTQVCAPARARFRSDPPCPCEHCLLTPARARHRSTR
jgi:hypothetical protein